MIVYRPAAAGVRWTEVSAAAGVAAVAVVFVRWMSMVLAEAMAIATADILPEEGVALLLAPAGEVAEVIPGVVIVTVEEAAGSGSSRQAKEMWAAEVEEGATTAILETGEATGMTDGTSGVGGEGEGGKVAVAGGHPSVGEETWADRLGDDR